MAGHENGEHRILSIILYISVVRTHILGVESVCQSVWSGQIRFQVKLESLTTQQSKRKKEEEEKEETYVVKRQRSDFELIRSVSQSVSQIRFQDKLESLTAQQSKRKKERRRRKERNEPRFEIGYEKSPAE